MVSVASASALITGVSLAVTATALIINTINNRSDYELKKSTIKWSVLFVFSSFYLSLFYLYFAEFNTLLNFKPPMDILFLLTFLFSVVGIAIPMDSFIN